MKCLICGVKPITPVYDHGILLCDTCWRDVRETQLERHWLTSGGFFRAVGNLIDYRVGAERLLKIGGVVK